MGKKTSTTTSQVQIPPEVMARYNAVNTRAEEVASKPFQKYGTEASDFVAQINQQQQQGIQNVNAAAGSYQPYIDAATGATVAGMDQANAGELNIGKYMSPYIQNVADTTGAMLAQENERAQSGNLGTAISSGAFGGDRAGIAAANLSQQQNLAYGKTMADIYNQGYTQAVGTAQQQQGVNLGADQANLARLTAGGAQLAGLGTTAQQAGLAGAEAQINAGTLEQQTEQAGKTALVNQFMQEQGYPFQVAQFLANIATGTGALSGSTTATTQPTPFFSDRRLKHDVKRIGKTDDGLPIYSFKYKGDEKEQTHVGFMADEVEKVKPEAVGVHPTGYKTVDYAKATENSMGGGVAPHHAGEAFADGGVAGPYGASANSQPNFGGYVPQAYLPVSELMVADPAYTKASNQNVANLMADSAAFGENFIKLDEQFGKDGTFWDAFGRQKEADGGGVNAQYLKPQQGGLVPNSDKSYLTDTLASQDKSDKPKLDAAPGGGGGGSSPAGDIAALAKVGLAIAGIPLPFRYGGAAGYADGGSPEVRLIREPGTRATEEDIIRGPGIRAREEDVIRGNGLAAAAAERTMPQAARDRFDSTPSVDLGSDIGSAVRSLGRDAVGYTPGMVDPGLASGVGMTPRPTGLSPVAASAPRPTAPQGLSFNLPQVDANAAPVTTSSVRPQARPADLGTAAVAQPVAPVATGVVAPQPKMEPVVPYGKQLDFITYELQKPEYSGYQGNKYATAGQAAIAFDDIYERSGGQGNDRAAANAEDIYSAAQNGDLSGFPPNVQQAYQHFIDNGMDPIQASGATGRLMVESYAHMDPNARNTINGGNGTYGIAQWRGDRMKELASFSGVPLDAITSAPISTPEGRYFPSGGGLSASSKGQPETQQSGLGRAALTSEKPYKDRNVVGKMFYNTDGTLNKNALLSVFSGLGAMASSPSLYFGSALLQGLGGAANTYSGLEQQQADILKSRADTASVATQLMKNSIFQDPMTMQSYVLLANGDSQLFSDWVKNPAGPSAGGSEADSLLRSLSEDMARDSTSLDGLDPERAFSVRPVETAVPTQQPATAPIPASTPGMSVQPLPVESTSFGSFPVEPADQGLIDRNTETLANMTPDQRSLALAEAERQRAEAVASSTAASGSFRNLNELGYVMANAASGQMGPLGNYQAKMEGIINQLAQKFDIPYDGSAATSAALLNKLSTLQSNQMTSDTAAAKLFIQNKDIFPDITSNPEAAADIAAAMFVDNMTDYEYGQFANDFYAAHGTFKSLDGANQLFAQKSGNLYQTEKKNISTLMRAVSKSNDEMPIEVKNAVKQFFDEANSGVFKTPAEAQEALEAIFSFMPGEHEVSSGLGRYFVR